MKKSRVTIRDVAAAAGVSTTTVSAALSGHGRLPEGTRIRVRAVAEKLQYKPSLSAQNLPSGRTGVILAAIASPGAALTATFDVDYFVQVLSSAADAAAQRGVVLALVPLLSANAQHPNIPSDGVIIIDPVPEFPLLREAVSRHLPLVTAGRATGVDVAFVDSNFSEVVPEGLNFLRASGATAPALLTSESSASYVHDCTTAYLAWCADHEVSPRICSIAGALTEEAARVAATRLLADTNPPDAFFATLDRLALGAYAALRSRDLPLDGRVLSLGDSRSLETDTVRISAIDLSPAAIGAACVEVLLDVINQQAGPTEVIIPGRLIARTTGAAGATT
jgi:DNA-binding LacI/PurR family transcriptional regulator